LAVSQRGAKSPEEMVADHSKTTSVWRSRLRFRVSAGSAAEVRIAKGRTAIVAATRRAWERENCWCFIVEEERGVKVR
jgi:hypothetical protein